MLLQQMQCNSKCNALPLHFYSWLWRRSPVHQQIWLGCRESVARLKPQSLLHTATEARDCRLACNRNSVHQAGSSAGPGGFLRWSKRKIEWRLPNTAQCISHQKGKKKPAVTEFWSRNSWWGRRKMLVGRQEKVGFDRLLVKNNKTALFGPPPGQKHHDANTLNPTILPKNCPWRHALTNERCAVRLPSCVDVLHSQKNVRSAAAVVSMHGCAFFKHALKLAHIAAVCPPPMACPK